MRDRRVRATVRRRKQKLQSIADGWNDTKQEIALVAEMTMNYIAVFIVFGVGLYVLVKWIMPLIGLIRDVVLNRG